MSIETEMINEAIVRENSSFNTPEFPEYQDDGGQIIKNGQIIRQGHTISETTVGIEIVGGVCSLVLLILFVLGMLSEYEII